MCYFYSFVPQHADALIQDNILSAKQVEKLQHIHFASGFDHPSLPVQTSYQGDIELMEWGLIPHWVKDINQAATIQNSTLNAKTETVFEKASFRASILNRRCLVFCSGFFEWHTLGRKKYPHYIFMKDESLFVMAGIWDTWQNPKTGEIKKSYAVLTTPANELMAKIHNTKQRMPLILPRKQALHWLDTSLDKHAIQALFVPLQPDAMHAYSIRRFSPKDSKKINHPDVKVMYRYPEIGDLISGEGTGEWTLFD